jgi:hypothetical protein
MNGVPSWNIPNQILNKDISGMGALVIDVVAKTDIDRHKMVTLDGVAIDLNNNEDEYLNNPVPEAEHVPVGDDSENPAYGAALEDIAAGDYGKVVVNGPAIVNIDVPSAAAYDFLQRKDMTTAGVLVGTDTATNWRILWNDPAATGTTPALVFIGSGGGGPGTMVNIDLVQVGGAQGNGETMPTWTYDVFPARDRGSGPQALLTAVDPTAAPHEWRRHLGQMEPATHGYGWYNPNGDFEIGWINEILIAAICEDPPGGPDA